MATLTQTLTDHWTRLRQSPLRQFFFDGLREVTSGGVRYHAWMASLTLVMCLGAFAYTVQLQIGRAHV